MPGPTIPGSLFLSFFLFILSRVSLTVCACVSLFLPKIKKNPTIVNKKKNTKDTAKVCNQCKRESEGGLNISLAGRHDQTLTIVEKKKKN